MGFSSSIFLLLLSLEIYYSLAFSRPSVRRATSHLSALNNWYDPPARGTLPPRLQQPQQQRPSAPIVPQEVSEESYPPAEVVSNAETVEQRAITRNFNHPSVFSDSESSVRRTPPQSQQLIQGNSRTTFSSNQNTGMTVHLQSQDAYSPLAADVQLWEGPNNAPVKMRVYSQDGQARPWSAHVGTSSQSHGSALDVSNQASVEFPFSATMVPTFTQPSDAETPAHATAPTGPREIAPNSMLPESRASSFLSAPPATRNDNTGNAFGALTTPLAPRSTGPSSSRPGRQQPTILTTEDMHPKPQSQDTDYCKEIQGDDIAYFRIPAAVPSVLVELWTEGLPMYSVVEVWQGPNCVKQIGEIYVDNGWEKPFSAALDTPGNMGCTVVVQNVGPMEYPIHAKIQAVQRVDEGPAVNE